MLQGTQQQKPSGITHHSGESQVDGTPGNPRLPFAFSGVVFVGLHLDTSFLASGTASCFVFFVCEIGNQQPTWLSLRVSCREAARMQPESAAGWSGPGEDGSPSSCESWCSPASQRLLPDGWVEGV